MARELEIIITADGSQAIQTFRTVDAAQQKVETSAKGVSAAVGGLVDQYGKAVTPTKNLADAHENLATKKQKTLNVAEQLTGEILKYASAGVIIAAIEKTIQYASSLEKMANAIGVSIRAVQQFENIAAVSNTTVEAMSNAIFQMQLRLAGGDKNAVEALGKLHIGLEAFLRLTPDEQFLKVARGLGQMSDESERNRVAFDLFGRSAREIMGALTGDVDDLKDGVHTMSESTVRDLNQLEAWWNKAWLAAARYGGAVLAMAVPKGPSPWLVNAMAGGVFDPTLDNTLPTLPGSPARIAGGASVNVATDMSVPLFGQSLDQQTQASQQRSAAADFWANVARQDNAIVPGSYAWQRQMMNLPQATGLGQLDAAWNYSNAMAAYGPGGNFGRPVFTNYTNGMAAYGPGSIEGTPYPSTGGFWANTGLNAGSLSGSIAGAVMGGGNVGGSIGATLAGGLGNSLGKMAGGTLGSIIPGVGTLLGSLAGSALGKLFGPSEESSKVSPDRDTWFAQAGHDLETLNPQVQRLTGSLTLVKNLFDAKTVTQWTDAVAKIETVLQLDTTATAALDDAVKRYGISIDELGPKWQQQNLDTQSGQLLGDYQLLIAAGVENDTVLQKMAGSFNTLAQQAMLTGSSIPEQLRAPLEKLQQMGLLVDENGDALTDLSKLNFAESLGAKFDTLIQTIQKLANAISGTFTNSLSVAGDAADRVFRDRSMNIDINYNSDFPAPEVLQSHSGSVIRAYGLERYHSGGLLPDERLIIGQTGEGILNRQAVANIGASAVHAMNRGQLPKTMGGGDAQLHREVVGLRADLSRDRRQLPGQLINALLSVRSRP